MTQVAKPSLSDGKMLSVELTKQFPEVPRNIIKDIMEKNSNNRELCFEALSRESQRHQHLLYGAPSPEEKNQYEDLAQGADVVFPWSGSQGSSIGRSSSSGQSSDQLEETFSKQLSLETPRLPQERPSVFHPPHSTYTPPVVSSLPVDAVKSQKSVVSPVSCPPLSIIFSRPFCQTYGVGDQASYPAASHQAASGASVTGESYFGAFADRPQNVVDPSYGLLQSPSIMVNSSRPGARSPLPTLGPHYPGYSAEPFQSMSTIPFMYNKSPSGSCGVASVGPTFHNQLPGASTGYRLSLSRENLSANMFEGSSNSACQPVAQLSCPGSGSPSRSGSLVGEDLTYIQALLIYQTARLNAFLVDLNEQKKTLELLRSEVSQLQKQTLDRRLCRNDTFPTAVDRQKLLTENQNLQMEIHLLTYEIDLANNGQTRLGWLDSEADQRFHDVIPSGQFNPLWPVTGSQLHVMSSYSSMPIVSSPRQPSILDSRESRPLRPTRPPPPPPYSAPIKATDPDDGESWNCSACTFLNHPLLNKCECCEMPKIPATPSALR